jgi:hypothetical protein
MAHHTCRQESSVLRVRCAGEGLAVAPVAVGLRTTEIADGMASGAWNRSVGAREGK